MLSKNPLKKVAYSLLPAMLSSYYSVAYAQLPEKEQTPVASQTDTPPQKNTAPYDGEISFDKSYKILSYNLSKSNPKRYIKLGSIRLECDTNYKISDGWDISFPDMGLTSSRNLLYDHILSGSETNIGADGERLKATMDRLDHIIKVERGLAKTGVDSNYYGRQTDEKGLEIFIELAKDGMIDPIDYSKLHNGDVYLSKGNEGLIVGVDHFMDKFYNNCAPIEPSEKSLKIQAEQEPKKIIILDEEKIEQPSIKSDGSIEYVPSEETSSEIQKEFDETAKKNVKRWYKSGKFWGVTTAIVSLGFLVNRYWSRPERVTASEINGGEPY